MNYENNTPDYDYETIMIEQMEIQENQGYSDDFIEAIQDYWTNGWYSEMQQYIHDPKTIENLRPEIRDEIQYYTNIIIDYLNNEAPGIEYDTVLYRGGRWNTNLKKGDIEETKILYPTTYSREYAEECQDNDQKYLIKIYAPYGTKGIMINSPSLADDLYDEAEFLMNIGQKYMILDVDHDQKTATIKIIP